MIVVASFLPRSNAEAVRRLRGLRRLTDPVELRIDGIRSPDIRALLSGARPAVIVTCRRTAEGGNFRGSAAAAARYLAGALRAGAEYVDAEYSLGPAILRRLFAVSGSGRIVLSGHDPERTPRGIASRLRRMSEMRPAFVKLAVRARTFADTGRVIDALREARRAGRRAAVISMGPFGSYTRILQGRLGGSLTYAALDGERRTGPGQQTYEELRSIYRIDRIDRRTKVFGLLGNPVEFSRGVLYHNGVFRRRRLNAVYVNFEADDAGDFFRLLGATITGLSVTMPFKREVSPFLDLLECSASLTGSVNTVLRRSGRLTGLNTDFHAFLSLLKRIGGARRRSMVVLGTGGTAATAAAAGVLAGAGVIVAGRKAARARRLAERFGCGWTELADLQGVSADILVNATPVGMAPGAGGRRERIAGASSLRRFRAVVDFANPPGARTALVDDAAALGLAVVTGEEIFRAQARLQSRLFLEAV